MGYSQDIQICMGYSWDIHGITLIFEISVEVKLPTRRIYAKSEVGRVREEKDSVERRSEKKKDAGARKRRKLAKVLGAEPSGRMSLKPARGCGEKHVFESEC